MKKLLLITLCGTLLCGGALLLSTEKVEALELQEDTVTKTTEKEVAEEEVEIEVEEVEGVEEVEEAKSEEEETTNKTEDTASSETSAVKKDTAATNTNTTANTTTSTTTTNTSTSTPATTTTTTTTTTPATTTTTTTTPATTTTVTPSVTGSFIDASATLSQINAYRTAAGLATLSWDSSMKSGAETRALECVDTFSHTRPDGSNYTTVGNCLGENLARGSYTTSNVVESWYNSSGHQAVMLNSSRTKVYVAAYQTSKGTVFVMHTR